MKYLKHPDTPIELEKRQKIPVNNPSKNWDSFNFKNKVKERLLPAQNHLCAYCEIELMEGENELGYHIEHIKPKSKYPDLTFEFTNLMVSCFTTGHELEEVPESYDSSPVSCGYFKENTYDKNLFIPPTEKNCEQYFFINQKEK